MKQKQINLLKTTLGSTSIASIRFSDYLEKQYEKFQDTTCTALARTLRCGKRAAIDRKVGQLCPGGNYFLDITKSTEREIAEVYVERERVFQNPKVCADFIKSIPPFPKNRQKRYILLSPIELEKGEPEVVILLINPAQVSRLLGLSVFESFAMSEIIPAGPTCISLFSPLVSKRIHLNFIDYFDRFHQGIVNGEKLWRDDQLIFSCTFEDFSNILDAIPRSAHGSFKPDLRPQKVDDF